MKGRNGPTSFLPSQRNGGIPKEMSKPIFNDGTDQANL